MPYFVYHVGPLGVLSKIAEYPKFQEASQRAKAERARNPGAGRVRVMFADNELAAEDLLSRVREPGPVTGEDD